MARAPITNRFMVAANGKSEAPEVKGVGREIDGPEVRTQFGYAGGDTGKKAVSGGKRKKK